jgi:cobalamin biosynthesis protein CobD/CbiB
MGLLGTFITQIVAFATGLSGDSRLANWLPAATVGNLVFLVFFAVMSFKNYRQRKRAFARAKAPSSVTSTQPPAVKAG